MTSRFLRLKDNHPTMQKLEKLFALADELGISISFNAHGPATVYDSNRATVDLPPFSLQDIDNPEYPMEHFPPTLEYRVIYENPEWLATQERVKAAEEIEKKRLAAEEETKRIRRQKEEAERKKRDRIRDLKSEIATASKELKKLEDDQ